MDKMRQEIRKVLVKIVENKHEKALNWAVDYARFGVELIDSRCDNEALRTQLTYVVGNITRWRGQDAKMVRDVLKEAIKGMQPVLKVHVWK